MAADGTTLLELQNKIQNLFLFDYTITIKLRATKKID